MAFTDVAFGGTGGFGAPSNPMAGFSNYGQVVANYQQTLNNQVAAQQGIEQGYSDLYSNVLSGIQNVGQAQSQAIADVYAQQVGKSTQDMVSRGLGNSTVTQTVQRGLTLDEQKAQTALKDQFAQLIAGYQSQLGLAGLGYRGQAAQQNTQLAEAQLGYQGQYGMQANQLGLGYAGLANQLAIARLGRGGGGGGGTGGGGGGSSGSPLSGLGRGWGANPYGLSGGGYGAGGGPIAWGSVGMSDSGSPSSAFQGAYAGSAEDPYAGSDFIA